MDIMVPGVTTDPEELLISQEEVADIEGKMDELLSPLEKEVVDLYLEGKSYIEIAEQLGRHVKSVDNALQRVKRKLEGCLKKRN